MRGELTWAVGLFAGVMITAASVNRFAVAHRARVRRIVILFVIYLIALASHLALDALGMKVWGARLLLVTELLQAFNVVNVASTLTIFVALPAVGVSVPLIVSDLLIGIGYIVATLGAFAGHGLEPSGVLATGAVVSTVLAISLQSTLGNILGGVALQLDGSIHEGDWIQLENGRQGRVRAVRWRHTVVETRDWSTIIVPNAQLLANNIMILGKREDRTVPQRMWVWFNVDFRFPPTKVIQVVTDALVGANIVGVATDPPPNVVCMDFTKEMRESFATYAVRYWLLDLAADDPTNSRVRARVYTALRRAGIPLAVPAKMEFVQIEDEARVSRRAQRHLSQRLAALRTVHLFRSLTEPELETLAKGLHHVIYTTGETMTRQGAVAHYLYVMTEGTAEVRTKFDPDGDGPMPAQTMLVAALSAPDFFGEMGLMTGEPRMADVVATSDVDCFRLGKETVEQVLLKRPEIATELSEKLATRRVELIAVREGLDANARQARQARERDRILGSIKSFFGL